MVDQRSVDILESIADAFVVVDHDWRYTYINDRALRRMQHRKGEELAPEAFLGQNMWEMFPEAVGTTIYEKYHKAMREHETLEYETYSTVTDKWIEVRAFPSEEGLSFYSRDITERKWAEERVEESRQAERSRIARDLHDQALQELADALIQTQKIHSLSKDPKQTQRLMRLLATLDRIGPRLRGTIYDLRLDAEHDQPFPELLEALVELRREMAPHSKIAYEVHDGVLSGPLGERGRQLLRIIGEALTNVRRHSGAQNARVSVSISEGKLWAEVEDDGGGFDAASYSEQALSPLGGLGIRGMRERARALGGEIKIESDPQRGTRVHFEMTLEKDHAEDSEEVEGVIGVRVLLVEDHAAIREALASTFEREGFEVVGQAGSIAEARGMLEDSEHPIDVALIDLGLPDGYGAELIEELGEAHPNAQALVLSATLDRATVARAVQLGAAGVLSKTTHLQEVVDGVRRLRRGQTLMALEEVVELLRFAGNRREEEHEAHQTIEKLTPREIEVLEALAEGLDSEGMAEKLNIALRTERNHMASILRKLGVHSQLQALVFALRHGLVEIS